MHWGNSVTPEPGSGRCDFLDRPAAEFAAPYMRALAAHGPPPPDVRLGSWRLIAELGRGGMGTVYLAERDDDQYHQQVALKVMSGWTAFDDHHTRRFREERRILAALDHPNIARLLDGGVTDDGVPWFAMEFVAGLPIDAHIRQGLLDVRARLQLFLAACDAVSYAHQHLVVHRDLKPGNLLVTDAGHVKLLDFGVARLLPDTNVTRPEQEPTTALPMTPAYASPEQIRGDAVAVSSDIYSLGVILHLLLTDRLPYGGTDLAPHELARAILEDDAPLPSTAAPPAIRRALRGDLDTIVSVATRKDAAMRYSSVAAFADDIRRHLDGWPIVARAHSRRYRAMAFVRRNRIQVSAAALIAAALLVGLAAAQSEARRADLQRDIAQLEAARANEVAAFLAGVLSLADPNVALGQTIAVAAALDSAALWLDREPVASSEARAEIAMVLGRIFGAIGRHDDDQRLIDTALAIQQRLFGPDDPRLGVTLTALAEAMRGQGRLVEAETQLRRALDLQRRDPALPSRDLDHTLNMLALSLRDQGRLVEAESLLHEALIISRRNANQHPIGLHRSLNNLAHVRLAIGDPVEAESLHREVLQQRRRYWGEQHPEVANTLINLAIAVGRQDRFEEAESLFVAGLAMRRRLQGADHPEIGVDLIALAALHQRQGDRVRAAERYREALAVLTLTLSNDHPRVRAAQESLAVVLR